MTHREHKDQRVTSHEFINGSRGQWRYIIVIVLGWGEGASWGRKGGRVKGREAKRERERKGKETVGMYVMFSCCGKGTSRGFKGWDGELM